MKNFILFVLFLFASFSVVFSQEKDSTKKEEIGIYEHLDEFIPNDIILIDKDSVQVNLKQLITKPTVISFVYYNCPGLCSPLLDGIAEVIDNADIVLGKDYQVITLSFNAKDYPALGISKKANYLAQIEKPIDKDAWIWLTGDSVNIYKTTNALGFKFKREGEDFVHAAAIMVISPDGKITRYLHGTYFLPFDLKMAVTEASQGKSGPTINKVLKFCFSYDAEGKKYVFNITKISGAIILFFAFLFFLSLVIKRKPKNNQ